jgi:hypothetical protein
LKEQCEKQVCRPQERTWKPPLPQYATTLGASGGQRNRKRLTINANNCFERTKQEKYQLKSVAKNPKTLPNA